MARLNIAQLLKRKEKLEKELVKVNKELNIQQEECKRTGHVWEDVSNREVWNISKTETEYLLRCKKCEKKGISSYPANRIQTGLDVFECNE